MNIQNSGDDGISGTSVTGFTMNRSNVTNNGNALNEDGVDFGGSGVITPNGLFGTATVTNSVFTGNYYNQFTVRNSSGTVDLTMTGSTITGRLRKTTTMTACSWKHWALQPSRQIFRIPRFQPTRATIFKPLPVTAPILTSRSRIIP